VTFTSYWIEYQLWGTRAAGYHAVNVALHAANTGLVCVLLSRLGLTPAAAGVVALLFAVSPVQVMSVAWIAERKNLLSTLFGLLSLLYAERYLRRGGRRAYAAMMLGFVASLLAKSAWLVLPLVVWATGRWVIRPTGQNTSLAHRARITAAVAPMLLLALASAWITERVEQEYADPLIPGLSERIRIVPGALLWYAVKTLAPVGLSPFYPFWEIDPRRLTAWTPVVILAVLAALLICFRRRLQPVQIWGLFWFVSFLLPVLGFVPYGNLAVTWVSDHYLYVACLGFYATVVTAVAAWLPRRPWDPRALAVCAPVIVSCIVGCWRLMPLWHNDLSFWQHVVSRDANSVVGHIGRATAWFERKDFDRAIDDYRRVLVLRSDLATARAELGRILINAGRFAEAADELRAVLPLSSQPHEVLANLGVALEKSGDKSGAIEAYRSSARHYRQRGEVDKALMLEDRILKLTTTSATQSWVK
jgi:hypothetical protein